MSSTLVCRFGDTFTLNPELPEETGQGLMAVLERRLGSLTVRNHEEMTHVRSHKHWGFN